MCLIPKRTKAENKVIFNLSFWKIGGLVMTMGGAATFGPYYVHNSLQILFVIVCTAFFVILTRPSFTNPKIAVWQGTLSWLSCKFMPKYYMSILGNAFIEYTKEKINEETTDTIIEAEEDTAE